MADNFYNNPQRTAAQQHQQAVNTAKQMSDQAQKRAAEAAARAAKTHKDFVDQANKRARSARVTTGRKQSGPLGKLVGLVIVVGLVLLFLQMAGMVRLF